MEALTAEPYGRQRLFDTLLEHDFWFSSPYTAIGVIEFCSVTVLAKKVHATRLQPIESWNGQNEPIEIRLITALHKSAVGRIVEKTRKGQ